MSSIQEVNALTDFGLTLDHFYGFVKKQVGNLQINQYIQLQATAIPLDLSEEYPWFSYGNLNSFFDVRLDPTPVADNIALLANARLSDQYLAMLSELISLVEYKELDSATLARIDALRTKILNNSSRINSLLQNRLADWIIYADASLLDKGNLTIFSHWSQGHHATREIEDLETEQARDQALISALRIRKYTNASDQEIVDAYAAATGPGARIRFPRFQDKEYGEEAKKFNAVYFATLPDNDSSLFANRQLATTKTALKTIATESLGEFSDAITKQSNATSSITTDWSAGGNAGWGPFKFSTNVSNHQQIKEDFSHTESISVGAKSLQAIPIDTTAWFKPDVYRNPTVVKNRRVFERYLGSKGSLLYHPTHLVVARGMNIKFTSSQAWQHDYESDFSSGGSASATVFGVNWGGGGKYSQSKKEQKIERRGHDLALSDGENIRILGYVASKNINFEDQIGDFAMKTFGSKVFY